MAIIRYIVSLYLSRFPVTEGKKYLYRLAVRYLLPKDKEVISKTKYGFYLKLNLDNPEHRYYYFYKSHDERYEINNLRKIIKQDYVCWDIGANIGFYSFLLASIANHGKVFSFEPISKTYEYLQHGNKINNFRHITLNNFALGSEKTSQKIFFNNEDLCAGTASFVSSEQFQNYEVVDIDTVDNVANNILVPDFIKIDVEGFQVQVVTGALEFFERYSPVVMIEIDEDTNQWMEDYFISIGYQFYKFNKNSLSKVDSIFNNGRNILFCKPESKYMKEIEEFVE